MFFPRLRARADLRLARSIPPERRRDAPGGLDGSVRSPALVAGFSGRAVVGAVMSEAAR
jgi:hypothetical protein